MLNESNIQKKGNIVYDSVYMEYPEQANPWRQEAN